MAPHHPNRPKVAALAGLLWLLPLTISLSACTGLLNGKLFKERAAEEPAPADGAVDKSFFVDANGKPKTFLCAWAPEMVRGDFGEQSNALYVNEEAHCNIEFEIKQDVLVGKKVQPSFPNDRDRWETVITIPIKKHFYLEKDKDQHGRETNKWIENDSRSHWSARPKMKLDLQEVDFPNLAVGWLVRGAKLAKSTTSAYEIEWDNEKGFLGFSVDLIVQTPIPRGWRSVEIRENQFKMRANFLRFEHDPTFKKTPFHQENSRFMNILHVMGRQVDGTEPELYAAHWDLREQHTIYLNGVPEQHIPTIQAAVEKWNTTFQEIGAVPTGHKAFVTKVANLKHPFDLRYPSINWISDNRLSQYSPLGIGMAHSDVRNGKIYWGAVNLYGGMLETYINVYTPLSASSANGQSRLSDQISPLWTIAKLFPNKIDAFEGMDARFNEGHRNGLSAALAVNHGNALAKEILPQLNKLTGGSKELKQKMEALQEQIATLRQGDPKIYQIINDSFTASRAQVPQAKSHFKDHRLIDDFGSSLLKKAAPPAKDSLEESPAKDILGESNLARRERLIQNLSHRGSFFMEQGLNVANLGPGWMNSPGRKTHSLPEMLESVVMDLTLHEIGHFLGLGHQFKENILPTTGTVPSRFLTAGHKDDLSAKATEEGGWTNYTSVMGYRSGRTEMITTKDDMKPGPHDELVLRYLYKAQYSTYDKSKDEFVFANVPVNGKIPAVSEIIRDGKTQILPVAYFPQCNDIEASYDADPFCNRWDRGSKAEDIVKNYFADLSDNLVANLYSMVGAGGDAEYAEWKLWHRSLDSFSRIRLFYDEMRRRLRSDADLKPLWNRLRADQDALFEFSRACQTDDPTSSANVTSQTLREIFKRDDIRDLCRANAVALNEFKFFANLPEADYTKIDHTQKYVAGGYLEGDAWTNYGHIAGSWYQLTNLPLKVGMLYNLMLATPYSMSMGMYPNFYFDHEENRYLYRTLYPREFTNLISDTVLHNMRFAATGLDDATRIGRSVLSVGGLLWWMQQSNNDSARIPSRYLDILRQQTEFKFSVVAILINPMKPDADSGVKANYYKKFTGSIYDFFTDKSTQLRDLFVLPNGEVLAWANGMFIYPITKMKFYSGNQSYVIAYKVDYSYERQDPLYDVSLKWSLLQKHDSVTDRCVNGFAGNGLAHYFQSNNQAFEGFLIPPNIAEEEGRERSDLFQASVKKAFDEYELAVKYGCVPQKDAKGNVIMQSGSDRPVCSKVKWPQIPQGFPIRSMLGVCDETLRGVGQVSAAAAVINGMWLGITSDLVEK